ncbi:Hpt domain-containing protein [Roseicella sp. DB1501]|uniref:Hpt domain-containing protein n=1 Tax=Roseicella sp. DB1501 TaxID=2730925 RepID=UPI0034A09EE8
MVTLRSAAEQGRDHRLTAHGLKGTAWNFGARRLGDLAASLEGASSGQLGSRLGELATTLETTLAALRAESQALAVQPG